jgi:hypothetical protein
MTALMGGLVWAYPGFDERSGLVSVGLWLTMKQSRWGTGPDDLNLRLCRFSRHGGS